MPSHQETNYYLTQYFIPPYPSRFDFYSSVDDLKNGMLSLTKMVTLMASASGVASTSGGLLTYLTNFQVVQMLVVRRPHFENHSCKSKNL